MAFMASSYARTTGETLQSRFDAATVQYQQGAFDRAATLWRQVAKDSTSSNVTLSLRAQLGVASSCQKMGLYQEAQLALSAAQPLLRNAGADLIARYHQQSGNLYLAYHQHAQAVDAFSLALGKAREVNNKELQAAVLNDYGNALSVGGYASDALAAHRQSLAGARELNLRQLALSASINIVRLQIQNDELSSAREALTEALGILDALAPNFEWTMTLLTATDLARQLSGNDVDEIGRRIAWLQQAEAYATATQNVRLLSLVYGYEAKDRLLLGEVDRAEELTRKAVFYAAQSQAHDSLYEWEWQLANLLRRQGKLDAAIDAFDRSLAVLTPIRQELLNGYHDSHAFFQQRIRPVYLNFVDALLVRADGLTDGVAQRTALDRARNILEALKSAELQDYFRDECVVNQESKSLSIDQIAPTSAILYPIVLDGRIELLLSVNGEFYRRTVTVEQNQLLENATRLREYVQDPTGLRFMPYANRLYRWLIEPVKQQLIASGVDTLVIVPDGVLRTIPFAALHNGERYLIEEFALAVTPSLRLTAALPLQPARANALIAGIAQSVQGFSPLPQVSSELATIHDRVGGTVLSNRDYTKQKLRSALAESDYTVIHMATHSVVGATPADSFLLTYDGKLTMTDLDYLLRIGEFRNRQVELLTLSACETAIGDERAALGLAGIAVKSGAKSVVASLWLVDDAATAQLMDSFYRSLDLRGEGAASKAKALRAAQLSMLGDPATAHPAKWAAFMMIGNWQ
jgi:CHAT domain-containing protein